MDVNCYCGSNISFQECCHKYIISLKNPPSSEALMRSRYAAFATQAVDYLVATTAILQRKLLIKSDILEWSQTNNWNKLEIIASTLNTVEFKAYYTDSNNYPFIHHEKSTFIIETGKWCYVEDEFY